MSSAHKHNKTCSEGSPGGKPRGNRLARRARSFKEDFLGILSQMRSPGGSGPRSGSRAASPSFPRSADRDRPPAAELEINVRQSQLALKHFRDVVAKDKLEMLPGNGTVVLETVTAIHVLLKKFLANEQSSMLLSATNQMYQSVAKLIKLCDDYILVGEKVLVRENVTEVLQLVEEAIQNLVSLSKNKLAMKEACLKLTSEGGSGGSVSGKPRLPLNLDTSAAASVQRSSLPDIPLTPRELQILQQTAAFVTDRHSHSSDNILRDSPPPKPPLPDRSSFDGYPPPLPPKKRHRHGDVRALKSSLENMSVHSKSSSLLSESAGSLDSVLNHSRACLLDESLNAAYLNGSSQSCCYWDSSSSTSNETKTADIVGENGVSRLSGSQIESGFSSYQSYSGSSHQRSSSSSQQFSARSSQISHVSHESHHSEMSRTNVQYHSSNVTDGPCSPVVTNGMSVKRETRRTKTTSSTRVVHDGAGDVISYCPAHRPHHHENPLEDGWSLFSSPSLEDDDSPPALPEKTRSRPRRERHPSQYDNVPDSPGAFHHHVPRVSPELAALETTHPRTSTPESPVAHSVVNQLMPLRSGTPEGCIGHSVISSQQHMMMSRTETIRVGDMVDSSHHAQELHSAQVLSSVQTDQGVVNNVDTAEAMQSVKMHSKTVAGETEETLVCSGFSSIETANSACLDGNPPPLPMKKKHIMAYMEMFGNASHNNDLLRHSVHVYQQSSSSCSTGTGSLSAASSLRAGQTHSLDPRALRVGLPPPALPPKRIRVSSARSSTTSPPSTPVQTTPPLTHLSVDVCPDSPVPAPESPSPTLVTSSPSILEMLDVSAHLIMSKPEEEGPQVRGGHADALIIHATKAHKNDFVYQEAFLTTYRTFLSPLQLIEKLIWRYQNFIGSQDSAKQRAAREGFSLLVRVVSDFTLADVEDSMMRTLMEFVQCLLCRGDLTMAKALRVVMLNKYQAKRLHLSAYGHLAAHQVSIRVTSFLDLKSEQVAEQMTLLDAELFHKIEIPEVLIWAQEQNEERSPNLTRFTEHFNKMSYWARSRVLEQIDAKEREKYLVKFIKIMKHLRKMNNFNSYLALLSALDSAPIRRLEWQRHITDALKDYCVLIDSSSSFRAYRQALADTQPPCIPYIGLVLQDLTFVHIGNNDQLENDCINFSKRWQQFNIVENMKKFKKGSYAYTKNERIIAVFNDFDDSLSEEALWQISEKIKPRNKKV